MLSLTRATESTSTPPAKFRINTDIFRSVFAARDQEVFRTFTDLGISVGADSKLSDLTASLVPSTGEVSNFDFDLSLQADNMGASSKNVGYRGTGKYDGAEFSFSGPISEFQIRYALGNKYNHDQEYDALVFSEQPSTLTINTSDIKVEGADLSDEAKAEVMTALKNHLEQMKKDIQDAKPELIEKFPMDLAIPYVFMFYTTQFAQNVKFEGKYIEFHFSLEHMNLLRKQQIKLLKKLDSEFYKETNARGEEMLAQLYIDDNFYNSFFSLITTIDKMYSLREFSKPYPNAAAAMAMLTTNTLGAVMPQFVEEYGRDRKLDVVFSPSHDLFTDGIKTAKPSGIYMDKNGNFKAQINIPAQINIEDSFGQWEPIRNIYITLVAKGKVQMDATDPDDVLINLTPKSVEMSQLVIKKGNEEVPMEQMMVQSMANIQLESLKKFFKTMPGHINTLLTRIPQEVKCFGFSITDFDIAFKKSQMQWTVYQKPFDNSNLTETCAKFWQKIRDHQSSLLKDLESQENPVKRAMGLMDGKGNKDFDKLTSAFSSKGSRKDEL